MDAYKKSLYRFIKIFVGILILVVGCSKESDSDTEYEDPRYFGYMEAKVNGELKTWGDSMSIDNCACDPFECICTCSSGVQSVYLNTLPDVAETIGIRWDISEDYGCEDLDAWYVIDTVTLDNITYYGRRDLCEDNPLTPITYICHDIDFSIRHLGDGIYRGTFSFVASRNCGEEEVVITDGKFEFKTELPLCDRN